MLNSTHNNRLFATNKLKIERCIIYHFFKMKYLKFELISEKLYAAINNSFVSNLTSSVDSFKPEH